MLIAKLHCVLILSVPASGNEKTSFQDCMKSACIVTQSSTTSSAIVPFATSSTLTSECNSKCLNTCSVHNANGDHVLMVVM